MGFIHQPKVVIICGPTCTGKSHLAIKLSKHFDAELISVDSRQAIKYLDVGTGKMVSDTVLTHGYDLVLPNQRLSAYDYGLFAKSCMADLIQKNKNIFLVGGTGFYFDVLTGRQKIDSSQNLNESLRNEINTYSKEELVQKIKVLDPNALINVDSNNPARLRRLLERVMTPKTLDQKFSPFSANYLWIGLTAPREVLYARADKWVDEIWDKNLVHETQHLIEMGFGNTHSLNGFIYKECKKFIEGLISKEDAIKLTKFSMHAYIRRQQTWFKKNSQILWVDITQDNFYDTVYNHIQRHLDGQTDSHIN